MEKIIDSYKLEVEGVKIEARIIKKEEMTKYEIIKQKISAPTEALLDEVKNKLIEEVKLSSDEILDPKIAGNIKEKFKNRAYELLGKYLENASEATKKYLIGMLINESLGLGDIEFLLSDILLEEIVINSSKEPIMIYHKKYGWLETNIVPENEDQILNYANTIARRIGRQITCSSAFRRQGKCRSLPNINKRKFSNNKKIQRRSTNSYRFN